MTFTEQEIAMKVLKVLLLPIILGVGTIATIMYSGIVTGSTYRITHNKLIIFSTTN